MNKQEIEIGDRLPELTLKDQNGEYRELSSFLGRPLVVYFYPKDDTPGCTIEACSFRDRYEDFKDLEAEVIGISADSPESHKKFAKRYRLNFTLLSDQERKAIRAFGVPRKFFGLTAGRVTYIFDQQGLLIKKFNSALQMKKHVKEALEAIKK